MDSSIGLFGSVRSSALTSRHPEARRPERHGRTGRAQGPLGPYRVLSLVVTLSGHSHLQCSERSRTG